MENDPTSTTPNSSNFDPTEFSILGWLLKNNIKNEKGDPLVFYDRLYLLDILTDWSPRITIKKASQIGGSLIFNLKALFAVLKFGWNIIYTHPTDGDVEEFVKSKTNQIIKQNPLAFAGLDSDSIYMKELKVGTTSRFLFLKGVTSKTAAIATTSDCNIHDEASRSDQGQLGMFKSRLTASKFKGTWLFSNPTTEKDALDQSWQLSDMKEWNVTHSCGLEQVIRWPESFDLEKQAYKCLDCGGVITDEQRRLGRWVNKDGIAWTGQIAGDYESSGWHMSHFMVLSVSAADIIRASEGDQEYFHNFVQGEPYNPGDLRVTRSTILDNWTPKDLTTGKWYLGVDVGNIKHYALGSEKGITKVGKFTEWSDLDDMMKFYKPMLVIDAMPDNTMSKYFVGAYRNALMSFFQENKNNPQTIVWWGEGERKGIVYSNRNRIIDQLIDRILRAEILFGVPSDKLLKDFVTHWETLRRVKVTDPKGIESYEWESTTGVDHFVFATLYYYLARLGEGNGTFFGEPKGSFSLIDADNVVQDISEMWTQNNQ
jgi:hypothetical protein